jgi:hypothetical protein
MILWNSARFRSQENIKVFLLSLAVSGRNWTLESSLLAGNPTLAV